MESGQHRARTPPPDGSEGQSRSTHDEGRLSAPQSVPSAIFIRKPSVETPNTVTRGFNLAMQANHPLPHPMTVHTGLEYSPRQSLSFSNHSSPVNSRPTSPSRAHVATSLPITASPIGSVHTSSESLAVPGQERLLPFFHERGRLEERNASRSSYITPHDRVNESVNSPSASAVLSPVTAHAQTDALVYPDQSLAALQTQRHPLNPSFDTSKSRRSPAHLHHSWSQQRSRDPPSTSPRATTPDFMSYSGRPGLYTPTSARTSSGGEETDESRYGGSLHPTHLQTPKETHKLLKDVDPISGRKIINNYEIMEKLGSGAHGTVKKGRNLTDSNLVAIKIVRRFPKKSRLGRQENPESKVKKEIAVLKQARHPHVVSLLEVIDDVEFKKVYLVLEYVELGEIVWRTRTTREIATFERERIAREIQGVSVEDEDHHLRKMNELLLQKRTVSDQHRDVSIPLNRHGKRDSMRNIWSLEHGDASEEDLQSTVTINRSLDTAKAAEDHSAVEVERSTRASSRRGSTQVNAELQHSLIDPLETVTYDALDAFSPHNLEGTMYGPYAADVAHPYATDTQATPTMHQTMNEQAWIDEDDEFLHVPSLTMSQALEAFRDTVLGLEYLHYQGIVHRDIKPANLLWTKDYRVKISDFGVSYLGKPIRDDEDADDAEEVDASVQDEAIELAKTVGTPAFYAPELCDPDLFDPVKHPERPQITGQIDVWALGVTLYGMIFGRLPFFDINEFAMYEKIARQEVYIPIKRLKGIEGNTDQPRNGNRRPADVLEYEEVDDQLRDLLKRLLHKEPSKRITLKEVKHHPWVLSGISNHVAWIDDTDPSVHREGKKIEITNTEIDDAVAPLTFVDRLKTGLRRLGSLARGERGRDARKRSESTAKTSGASPSESPRTTGSDRQSRKHSLRGDEKIFSALQASRDSRDPRDPLEHPLAHSSVVSPDVPPTPSYFGPIGLTTPTSSNTSPTNARPDNLKRMVSTADSMKTIRAPVNPFVAIRETSPQPTSDPLSMLGSTHVLDHSSTSSLGSLFGGAGRRLTQSFRSRERGRGHGHESPNQSSRSSSIDKIAPNLEDPHASPSIAISSAFAAGRVDQPPVLRGSFSVDEAVPLQQEPSSPYQVSSSFQDAREQNYRRQLNELQEQATVLKRPIDSNTSLECPPSPDDDMLPRHQRPSTSNAPLTAVSSSDDQMASYISESFSQRSIPSVVTEASSWEALGDEGSASTASTFKPSTSAYRTRFDDRMTTRERVSLDRHGVSNRPLTTDDDEAGYIGDGDNNEEESDGEDDGLMIGSVSGKKH